MTNVFELESKDTYSLDEFWSVRDDNEFAYHLAHYIFAKSIHRKLPLSTTEQNIWDLEWLYTRICGEGFCDLFYQQYSLADCKRLEVFMRDLNLKQLADWFAEAKDIYCRHRTDLAESEYQQLEPFSLSGTEGDRFDELGKLFIGERSELFDIGWRIRAYADQHRSEIT
ncbi:MAG: DUF4375 domain-containing protein [Verrucomicrobia bacterium]|nr:DUF4375 domain-containing protein [Verrucomicrobiota bacterium]